MENPHYAGIMVIIKSRIQTVTNLTCEFLQANNKSRTCIGYSLLPLCFDLDVTLFRIMEWDVKLIWLNSYGVKIPYRILCRNLIRKINFLCGILCGKQNEKFIICGILVYYLTDEPNNRFTIRAKQRDCDDWIDCSWCVHWKRVERNDNILES